MSAERVIAQLIELDDVLANGGVVPVAAIPTLAALGAAPAADLARTAYFPEDYGAVGDGTTDDRAALQATITAATAAGGGRVLLSRPYAIRTIGGNIPHLGVYPNVDYGIRVDSDYVVVEATGAGALILPVRPPPSVALVPFALLLFGNGGSTDGSSPGPTGGTWRTGVGAVNVRIDCSALSPTDLLSMSSGIGGACIIFSRCQDHTCVGCHIINGFGYDGAIVGNSGSRYGRYVRNHIAGAYKAGLWCDGGRYCVIAENIIEAVGTVGINLQANLDNNTPAYGNVVLGNVIDGYANLTNGVGIGLTGAYENIIANNRVVGAQATCITGISVSQYATSGGKAEGSRNKITGNRLVRSTASGTCFGMQVIGVTANAFDGTVNPAADNDITGNHFGPNWTVGVQLGQQAIRTNIQGNHFECTRLVLEGDATALTNTWGANTFGASAAGRANEMTNSLPALYPKAPLNLAGQGTPYDIQWDATHFLRYGTGSPEGVVTAGVGSIFVRNDGGSGTVIYHKKSGTGNTGWEGYEPALGNPGVDHYILASTAAGARSWVAQAGGTAAIATVIPLMAAGGVGSVTLTSPPSGLTEFAARLRTQINLINATQARLIGYLITNGQAGTTLVVQYSTDQVTWAYLDNVSGPTIDIGSGGAALKVSAPVTLVAGAKADVFLRLCTLGGNASASPVLGRVDLQVW